MNSESLFELSEETEEQWLKTFRRFRENVYEPLFERQGIDFQSAMMI